MNYPTTPPGGCSCPVRRPKYKRFKREVGNHVKSTFHELTILFFVPESDTFSRRISLPQKGEDPGELHLPKEGAQPLDQEFPGTFFFLDWLLSPVFPHLCSWFC